MNEERSSIKNVLFASDFRTNKHIAEAHKIKDTLVQFVHVKS
jgi:hypothetical protein